MRFRAERPIGAERMRNVRRWPPSPIIVAVATAFLALAPRVAAQGLELGEAIVSFGELESPEVEVIGEIHRLAVGPEGDVLIVDRQSHRVGWLTSEGGFMGWLGREGDGPREFRYLGGVDALPGGRFLVVDQNQSRLVVLAGSEGGLEFDRTIPTELIPWEVCLLGERIFVSGLHQDRVVHELGRDGRLLQSFGEPIRGIGSVSERWQAMVDRYSAMGELTCVEQHDLVIMTPGNMPEIRAFRPDGTLAWSHTLEPWAQFQPTETADGRFVYGVDPRSNTTNSIASAWVLEDQLAVQIQVNTLARAAQDSLEVRYLRLADGTVAAAPGTLPRIAAVTAGRAVGWETAPFPRVRIWRIVRETGRR
jgi:hypothetical protein